MSKSLILCLLALLFTPPSWAITQTTGANVSADKTPAPSCTGTLTYTQQESFTVAGGGVVKNIAASTYGQNLGVYVYQAGTSTVVDYVTQIPLAPLGVSVSISSGGSPIQVPENLIFSTIDANGAVYVAYRVKAAVPSCASPSSDCFAVSKIQGTTVTTRVLSTRINSIQGIIQDDTFLYIRAMGTGAVGEDTFPAIHRVPKSTILTTTALKLQSAVESGLSGAPAYDPITKTLFSASGITNGQVYIVDATAFTVTSTAAQSTWAGSNTSLAFVNGKLYVYESVNATLERLNPLTGVSELSVGLGNGGPQSMIADAANNSLHFQFATGGANSLQRFATPGLSAQNTIAGGYDSGIASGNVRYNRIFETNAVDRTLLRSVKTCSAGV